MLRVVLSCALFMQPLVAQAQEFMVLGAGNQSCGTWVKNPATRQVGLSWVLGFLTAMNASEAIATGKRINVTEGTDTNGVELWITNFCTANPLAPLSDATGSLFLTLKK